MAEGLNVGDKVKFSGDIKMDNKPLGEVVSVDDQNIHVLWETPIQTPSGTMVNPQPFLSFGRKNSALKRVR
jgi:hypothetical protein